MRKRLFYEGKRWHLTAPWAYIENPETIPAAGLLWGYPVPQADFKRIHGLEISMPLYYV
jgi:hypothetical protein